MEMEEKIFQDLLDKVKTDNFDDEYLQRLGELEEVTRDPALVPVFAACFAMSLGEWEQARLFAAEALSGAVQALRRYGSADTCLCGCRRKVGLLGRGCYAL